MSEAYEITVLPQVVVTLLPTGLTLKNPVVVLLPTNLTIQPPAKGVGEVTDQATVLPITL
jgi:hypothetical protein